MRPDIALVKIGAAFIFIYALQNFAWYMVYEAPAEGGFFVRLAGIMLVLAVPILIAWFLWRFPAAIIGSLYGEDSQAGRTQEATDRVLLIGVTLLGAYTLTFGIIDLAYYEAHRVAEKRLSEIAGYEEPLYMPSTYAGRVTNILQIVLGLLLTFGRHGVVRLLRSVRHAGEKGPGDNLS